MFLTKAQVESILRKPYYSTRVTEDMTKYDLYRKKFDCSVYTVRFNVNRDFDEEYMNTYLLQNVMSKFPGGSRVLAAINYDVLLVNPRNDPPSYYVWRANTNQSVFDNNNEQLVKLTYNNLYTFIQDAAYVDLPSLSLYFAESSVQIDRLCAIVFSFATT